MPRIRQDGFAHIFLILILVAAVGLGVYLIGQKTNIFPKAASGPIGPETSFTLNAISKDPKVGGVIAIEVLVSSDFDESNTFSALISYPADKLELVDILPPDPSVPRANPAESPSPKEYVDLGPRIPVYFIKKWIEQSDDKNGNIVLSGSVPNPGFRTQQGERALMAHLIFKTKKIGEARIDFKSESAIYRNSDNQNILTITRGAVVNIGGVQSSAIPTPSLQPSSTPLPSSSSAPTPPSVDGKRADLYKDPKKPNFVNDQDISVFYSKCAEKGVELFGQPASVQITCDIFEDGKITVQDWAVLLKFRNKAV